MTYPILNATSMENTHPEFHNAYVDVKAHYGAVGDGVTDDTTAIQNAVAAGAGDIVFFPAGTYKLTSAVETDANTIYRGAGRDATIVTASNAYAFTAPATGSQDRVVFQDMTISLRAGATSGGAIKVVSNSYHSGWLIERVDMDGVSTSTDPVLWLDGWINNSIISHCNIQNGAGNQVLVDSTGFVSNSWQMRDSRMVSVNNSAAYAGLKVNGGALGRVRDCTFESLEGYGLWALSAEQITIEGCWFEDNGNHDVILANCMSALITGNRMNAHTGGASADHISITRSASGQRDNHLIMGNSFPDDASSGVNIRIGTDVEFTFVAANRRGSIDGGFIVDDGTYSTIIAGDRIGNATGDGFHLKTYISLAEIPVNPALPSANRVSFFAKDNGAGKTAIYALYPDNSFSQITIQP